MREIESLPAGSQPAMLTVTPHPTIKFPWPDSNRRLEVASHKKSASKPHILGQTIRQGY